MKKNVVNLKIKAMTIIQIEISPLSITNSLNKFIKEKKKFPNDLKD